jgi:hypothetical protein
MSAWGTRVAVAALALAVLPVAVAAVDGTAAEHLGVASCAGNTCHGSTRPFADTPILQTEYFTWQRKDAHARAYEVLLSARSQAIATRLGLGKADEARDCLVCHAENAPPALRGPRYQVSDGIGCEACHGPAQHWIATHTAGYKSNAARLADGLYPTWNLQSRAELCAGCHVGDARHPMSHAIMAAGHPPILFELNTYETLEPPHWQVDADYSQRKGTQDPAQEWFAGQVAAAGIVLDNLAGPRLMHGAFPELAFYDCDACHHSMKAGRASIARNAGLPDGTVPVADAPLVLVGRWLDAADPAAAGRWWAQYRALAAANAQGPAQLQAQARAMRAELNAVVVPKIGIDIAAAPLRRLVELIVADARHAHRGDYAYAQQTAMAVSVLVTSLASRGDANVTPILRAAVDALYAQVHDRDRFSVVQYTACLEHLAGVLGGAALNPATVPAGAPVVKSTS